MDPDSSGALGTLQDALKDGSTYRLRVKSIWQEFTGKDASVDGPSFNQWQNFMVDSDYLKGDRGAQLIDLWLTMLTKYSKR